MRCIGGAHLHHIESPNLGEKPGAKLEEQEGKTLPGNMGKSGYDIGESILEL